MKIVLAPDKFKGSLTALEVCEAMESGVRRVFPEAEIVKVPMADGGEGTAQALVDATGGAFITEEVTGPLGERVSARFGMLGDGVTAVIEMAEASGFKLVPAEKRNPLITTTFGTGELIRAAIERGATRLIIGIGGSATNDGGAGCAMALGARLLDEHGRDLEWGGAALAKLARIEVSALSTQPVLSAVEGHLALEVMVACDVDNPLTGAGGATAVFGPQKGATPKMVRQLDSALARFAEVIRRDLGKDVEHAPGAGAAGGLGAGLMAFLDAKLLRGIEIVIEATQLRERMKGAQLVFTGEGRIDEQTAHWKAPMGVAQLARELGAPIFAVVGSFGADWEAAAHNAGIDSVINITSGLQIAPDEARRDAARLVARATQIMVEDARLRGLI